MIVIGNGPLLTRDSAQTYYEKGAVVIDQEVIVEVGEWEELKGKYEEARCIDVKGTVMMPGLINAHSHIYSAFARGLQLQGPPPRNFLQTLEELWWQVDAHLSLEEVQMSALMTYMESVKRGVTTVIDHHASYGAIRGSLGAIAKAASQLGVRTCLAYEISDRHGKGKCMEALQESMAFLSYVKGLKSSMVKSLVGLHAAFTLSDETFKEVKRANTFGAGYHIHVSESSVDESFSQQHYGKSVVRRLYEKEILGEKTLAGHCIHISEGDRALLKETNTRVIHNPASNMNNGVGAPNLFALLDEGIVVGLGTDGYNNDLLESLRFAHVLQKHQRQMPDRGFVESGKCLFTHNGQIASEMFGVKLGVLESGAQGDVIVVDYTPYTPMTADNIESHIMFGMIGSMVDTTIINGQIVMTGKKLVGIEETELLEASRELAKAFWQKF